MEIELTSLAIQQLFDPDGPHTLVLTVNNRYARRILARLSAQLDAERRVMALPDIIPLRAWLQQAADELSFQSDVQQAWHVIDNFGSRSLWQQVVADVEAEHFLLDCSQAAKLAMDADRLMSEWLLDVQPEEETTDYQRFALWRKEYRRRLRELDAEDAVLGFEEVCKAVQSGQLRMGFRRLVLAGFSEFSPRLAGLLHAMESQGVVLYELASESSPATQVSRVVAADPDTEWRLAAQWAAEQLRSNPDGSYAIVAAQLENHAALAHRVLREALFNGEDDEISYNVAVARPLDEWPLTRAALAWLRLLSQMVRHRQCKAADIGAALRAGRCLADLDESDGRARLDAWLRTDAVVKLSLGEFTQHLVTYTPEFARAWQNSIDHALSNAASAPIDIWVSRFKHWLQELGFPGQTMLDSHAYQTVEAFERVLEGLARQSLVLGDLDFVEAVSALASMVAQTPFQPQRDPSARLDVQGLLEAEGGRWDAVWVLGLTDEVLPAVPRPNPLLPLSTLRRADAPRATPERELLWAQTMFDALLRTAPEIWLSHARQEGERELRASPFIAPYPNVLIDIQAPGLPLVEMESIVDDRGPALPNGAVTRGGIAVLDTQARNPLWAFTRYRLGARQLPDYADVADQSARGIFLHRCMELLYKEIPDSQTLEQALAQGSLDDLLDQSLNQAADESLVEYGPTVRGLEVQRAKDLLQEWFDLELQRGGFAVKSVEYTVPWSHGPLQLSLRLDRVDELPDGTLAVIDYKTGGGSIDPKSDWMRERPVGLQLPFYAALLANGDQPVGALLLAKLHAKGLEIKGLSDGDCGFPGPATLSDWADFKQLSWSELMDQWRGIVQQLADEYACGVAVNTQLRTDDLKYCEVLPFLRLTQEDNHVD